MKYMLSLFIKDEMKILENEMHTLVKLFDIIFVIHIQFVKKSLIHVRKLN